MLAAQELAAELNMIFSLVNHQYEKRKKELSQVDSAIQKILHQIEFEVFNVVKGYFFSKKIKDLRLKRRAIKAELEALQSLSAVTQKSGKEIAKFLRKTNEREIELNKLLTASNGVNLQSTNKVNDQDGIKITPSGNLA